MTAKLKIDELSTALEQYHEAEQKLAELAETKQAATRRLAQLEDDLETDLDEVAVEASRLNASVVDSDFRIRSITKRQAVVRWDVVDAINEQQNLDKEAQKEVIQQRRDKGIKLKAGLVENEAFNESVRTLRAIISLGGAYSWGKLLDEVMPQECTKLGGENAAIVLGHWVLDAPEHPMIEQAKQAIDYDSDVEMNPHDKGIATQAELNRWDERQALRASTRA